MYYIITFYPLKKNDFWAVSNGEEISQSCQKFYRTKDGQIIYRKMCAIDQALEELLSQGKFNDEHIDRAV